MALPRKDHCIDVGDAGIVVAVTAVPVTRRRHHAGRAA
jgi:hypothetical protein